MNGFFQTALNIKSVGKGKLSIVLFYVNPERYVPFGLQHFIVSKKQETGLHLW